MKIKTNMFRLITTECCNAKCKFCLAENTPKPGQKQSIQAVEKAAQKAKEAGAKEASISGGEPLLDKQILPKIKAVAKHFKTINLQTNATLLKNAKKYKEAGIKNIIVNFPSCDKKTYEELLGIDSFDTVVKNLKEAVKVGLNVRLNSVLAKGYNDDLSHVLDMIQFSKDVGLTELTFTQMVPTNKFCQQKKVSLDKIRKLFMRTKQLEQQKFNSIDVYKFLDMTIGLSSCPYEENAKAFQTGWAKEYVLTENSRLVTDYFNQENSTMEVL